METSLASSDDLRFSAAFHVVYHLGLGILCFSFVAHALRGYARSVETLNEQLCEFKAAGTSSSCCDQGHGAESDTTVCDRAILFQCIAHWYGSLDKFESQVQSKVRAALIDQLANKAISYQRLLLLFTPYVWIRFEYTASYGGNHLRQIADLAQTFTYWMAVYPFMNKLLFRLCYRFRARCCRLHLDILLSAAVVITAFLYYFTCYIIQLNVFQQNRHDLLLSMMSLVSWLAVTAILWRIT